MTQANQFLKSRQKKGLNQIPEFWVPTPLLGNRVVCRDNWQVIKGKNLSASQQQKRAKFETKVEREG